MTIGIFGRRGHGKTQLESLLGLMFKEMSGLPLYSNYGLIGSEKITLQDLLFNTKNSIICLDEFWQKMDSRAWKDKDQIFISHWYQMQRHLNIVLVYTTQLLSQIEKRIRDSTDYFILSEMRKINGIQNFKYTVIDGFTLQPIKIIKTDEKKIDFIWRYYDHVGFVDSLD